MNKFALDNTVVCFSLTFYSTFHFANHSTLITKVSKYLKKETFYFSVRFIRSLEVFNRHIFAKFSTFLYVFEMTK